MSTSTTEFEAGTAPFNGSLETRADRMRANIERYGIDRWSHGYFGVSEKGNVMIKAPTPDGQKTIELTEVINGLRQRGLDMPVMLRIENLLDDRVSQLNEAFRAAIEDANYRGTYRGVFPVKVNQQNHVIAEIARVGERFSHGLEAGSKAELLIAMSTLRSKDCLIVCNGYKDEEFIDLGLQARKIGFKCFFVLETVKELSIILERAKHWDVEPLIGVRVKLSTKVDGHWSNDSGDRSMFGLTTMQIVEVADRLKEANMLHCLQLLHFHLGSQIPNIRNIRDGVTEACRYYMDLVNDGAPMGYFNLGGGLAVDYDGSASTHMHSRNYDLNEYCVDIVETLMNNLDAHEIEHPTIITESGRWTVAPMSVLLFNILSVSHFDAEPLPDPLPENLPETAQSLLQTLNDIDPRRLQESYNDALYYRDQMRDQFRIGEITLRERALGENIYLTIVNKVASLVPQVRRPSADLVQLCDSLSDIYYGNFSVFQSLPDAWAIEQVFPVMPLQRLDEIPTRRAIIGDLTCDCDGKLDNFVDEDGPRPTLQLHELSDHEDYYLGVFLVGAYQETLGDLHNLFGDNNVATVRMTGQGQLEFVEELHGDSISDVLSYVEYHPAQLVQRFRESAEGAVREGRITVAERQQMMSLFNESLRGYTYFES
ncbi:biosynthetic arginine decarboxylase [Rubinisphaera sp. JC750]|uniref:biosynthetic arginine decarboxylase n=1 Tax=Rubinisphaera sp. JC750 TaxID=2898658 RepID=UPI001F0222B0|nr:biosynthetic arginine decarboxylase [Rubinisphaera sp. JC750]